MLRFILSSFLIFSLVSGDIHIYAIPVGQGDGAIVQCPNGKTVLIDMGSSSQANKDAIYDFARKFAPFDSIIVSHPDKDHYNLIPGFPGISGNEKVYIGGSKTDYDASFLQRFKASSIYSFPMDYWGGATSVPAITACGSGVNFHFIAANNGGAHNEMTLVVQLQHGSFTALFTGDFEGAALESQLIARHCPSSSNCPLRSTLYKVSHHGADTNANGEALIRAVAPQYAYVSTAFPPGQYGHPRCTVTSRLSPYLKATSAHRLPCSDSSRNVHLDDVSKTYYSTSVFSSASTLDYVGMNANVTAANKVTQNLLHWIADGRGAVRVEVTNWYVTKLDMANGDEITL